MAQNAQGTVKNVHSQPPGYIQCNGLECPYPDASFDSRTFEADKPMGYEANRDALPANLKSFPSGGSVAILGG